MATKDLYSVQDVANTLVPAARTASGNGSSVDLQDYDGALISAVVGTITDGTHGLVVQESADASTWSTVAATDLQGSFANLASSTNQKVGYLGNKRYLRVNNTASGTTTGGVFAVVITRGAPRKSPV